MKIYLAGSVGGGRDFENSLQIISDILDKLNHQVLTKDYVVKRNPKDAQAVTESDRREIVVRDMQAIKDCDVVVMEVSQNSHGVGYEHRFAEELQKPILLLRHESLNGSMYSAFLDGQDYGKQKFYFYDENNIEEIVNTYFNNL